MKLTRTQRSILKKAAGQTLFLEGPAGTGKTTVGLEHLKTLLESAVPAESILVMMPQRTLALPYYDLLNTSERPPGGQVNIVTLGGIARRAVDLFWPLIASSCGFAMPDARPTFLTLETAQYFMARVVGPIIEREGYFDTVAIERNRLYSQIIDNLNKAAVVGFSIDEIAPRLKAAWIGDDTQRRIYDEVSLCAETFRVYCYQNNLLDFSLQVEIFMNHLIDLPQCRRFFFDQYRHIIADNVEEDTPAAHYVLRQLCEKAESALLIYDAEAGYRRFLAADPESAYRLKDACEYHLELADSLTSNPELHGFAIEIARSLERRINTTESIDPRPILRYDDFRYHPQMIDGVADEIASLVNDQGVDPGEIVVIAPFLSDALRFSLTNRLEAANVPSHSHRPSRALREEPAARCLLTLAQLAHPSWGLRPTPFDVVYALMESIAELDLVRAQLLIREAFLLVDRQPRLSPFEEIPSAIQQRITFVLGTNYDRLRTWIDDYIAADEHLALDHFFSRLFGEVLSQPGFGFTADKDSPEVTANLVDSALKFRRIISETGPPEGKSIAHDYVEMVIQGIIADQYLRGWDIPPERSVLLAPAYTFLLSNRPVDYQFWLNVGGEGWAQRLYQPLTNPYVLSQNWDEQAIWTDAHEHEINREALYRLVSGLTRRCRKEIFLGFSELGEQGYEQRGALLMAIQQMLRRLSSAENT